MVHETMVKWGVLANTSTRRLPADFTLPGIAATVAAGTENEEINQSIDTWGDAINDDSLSDLNELREMGQRFFAKDMEVGERDRRLVELNVLA